MYPNGLIVVLFRENYRSRQPAKRTQAIKTVQHDIRAATSGLIKGCCRDLPIPTHQKSARGMKEEREKRGKRERENKKIVACN